MHLNIFAANYKLLVTPSRALHATCQKGFGLQLHPDLLDGILVDYFLPG